MLSEFFVYYGHLIFVWFIKIIIFILPLPLSYLAVKVWTNYRNDKFLAKIKWILLEINIPKEITKSPAAMEMFFSNALYNKNIPKGFLPKYVFGLVATSFSLEIISIDGKVRFFIRTPQILRNQVETQIYSQYPQAKVVEAEDYVFNIPDYTKDMNWMVWGTEFKKQKEDFLPIKTYRDFGDDLRVGMEEEYKTDPIVPLIEFLGSVPKGQQVWLQILVKQCSKTYKSEKDGKMLDFSKAAVEFMDKIMKPYTSETKNEKGEVTSRLSSVPEYMKTTITNTSRNLNQYHYDVGIRIINLTDKNIHGLDSFFTLMKASRLMFRSYANPGINEFVRANGTSLDFTWSDPTGLSLDKIKKRMLDFYRTRTFFFPPLQYNFNYPKMLSMFFPSGKPNVFVLSSEELATIFHFPGMVSETPSFKRIETKNAKPPSNLPI